MKIILYTGIGIFALFVGFVLIVPGLMDWTQHKDQISDRVAYELGRDFSISGDISLSLIPETKFSLSGVGIGSIEGASIPSMVQVKSVDVEVALIPLLMGSIQIVRVILVEPTIILERLADGRRNWVWTDSEKSDPKLLLGKFLRDVSLEEFVISGGKFEYLDVSSGNKYQIEDANLMLSAPSLNGPFQFDGALRAFGIEVVLKSILAEIDSDNNIHTRGEISSRGIQLKYSASSNATNDGGSYWEGAVKLYPGEENDLPIGWSKIQEVLVGTSEINPELAQLTSDFTWGDGVFDLSQLTFRAGELKGAGAISIGPSRVSGKVDLGHLNLDNLFDSRVFPDNQQLAAKMTSKISEFLSNLSDKPDFFADIRLAADLIRFRGEAIRDVLVDIDINDGVMSLNQGSASLPGASSIALEGQFYLEQGIPGFFGVAEGSSDNLRALLKWLSVELSPLSGERLRRVLFSTQVQGTLVSGSFTDMDLQFDTSQIRGGVAYAASNGRLGLGIGLHVDQLDLDAYLPQVSENEGRVEAAHQSYGKLLSGLDADFDVQLDEVTVHGIPISGVILNGLWQQDALDVREVFIREFLGSSIKFTGVLSDLSSNPSIQGSFSGATKKLASLARIIPEIHGLPKYLLGPLELELAVQGDIEQITMDGFVEILESQIAVRGSVADVLKTGKVSVSAKVNLASLSAFGDLLSSYDVVIPGVVLETDIPLTLDAEVTGAIPNFDMSVVVMGAGGRLEAKGTLVYIARVPSFNLYGDFSHPNIGEFAETFVSAPMPTILKVGPETVVDLSVEGELGKFGWEANATRGDLKIGGFGNYGAGKTDVSLILQHPHMVAFVSDLGVDENSVLSDGPIDLSLILNSELGVITVPELEMRTPASDFRGALSVHTIGDKQEVRGSFTSRNLDLNELSALVVGISSGTGSLQGSDNFEGELSQVQMVTPVQDGAGLIGWDDLSADLTLEVAKMRGLGQKFEKVDARLNIESRSVNIEYFNGVWSEGKFNSTAVLANEPTPSFDVSILLEGANLTELLAGYKGFGPISGKVTLEANLTGEGRNKEQRLASLSGNGRVTGAAGGTIRGISFNEFFEQSRGSNQVGDFIDLVPTILGGGQTLFTGFNGNFEVEKGTIKTDELVFMLDKGKATVSGLVDLEAWTQDIEVEALLTAHDFSLPLKLYITGDIGAPDAGVRIPELEDYLQSIFPEVQHMTSDEVLGVVQDADNMGMEQVLEDDRAIGAAEGLIERLIELDSPEQADPTENNLTPVEDEDAEFRDLLQQLLRD